MKRFVFALATVFSISTCIFTFSNSTQAASGPPAAVLSASNGIVGDSLGNSVAITGDTIFAANFIFDRGRDSTIYVFEKPNGGWTNMTENARLTVPSGDHNRGYTYVTAIAASGDVVVASSPVGTGGGNLYVFVKPPTGWADMTPTAVLRETGGGDRFGYTVAIDGDTIVAGDTGCNGVGGDLGPGTAVVFQKPPAGWRDLTETAVLSASDAIGCDEFGTSVGVSGDTVVVGASRDGITPPVGPGELYIFEKPQSGWANMTETAELSATTQARFNLLGGQVAIGGNTVAATGRNFPSGPGLFVFVKPQGGWANGTQTATLLRSKPGSLAVNLAGTAMVAGEGSNHLNSAGSIGVYLEPNTGWQDADHANHAFVGLTNDDRLGSSVGIAGATIAAGAPGATVNGNAGQGAVYVY